MKFLQGENITFSYENDENFILKNLSFFINKNEFVTIIAPSGSGKSTLFKLILGLIKPEEGSITINESENKVIGYMPQKDCLMPWRTILQNASIGLELNGYSKKAAETIAKDYFKEFKLEGTEKLYPNQLSGGMRQRASFLRAIVNKPSLLLLDEPFSALDALTRRGMQNWLLELWERERNTVFMITHDIDEALLLSDRILICKEKPFEKFFSLNVDIKRPRNYETTLSEEFIKMKKEVLSLLGEDFGEMLK